MKSPLSLASHGALSPVIQPSPSLHDLDMSLHNQCGAARKRHVRNYGTVTVSGPAMLLSPAVLQPDTYHVTPVKLPLGRPLKVT